MNIYYLVPVSEKASWGMGIIYDHVNMLRKGGYNAVIIKEKDLKVPSWLHVDVPIYNYTYLKENIDREDILVVPEVMINFANLKKIECRKLLLIQAPAYIFESMPKSEDHISLGFEHVMIIMPHLESIIEKHINLPHTTVRPFVADYFFSDNIFSKRKRQILIYPKFQQIDYSIVKYLITRHIKRINKPWVANILNPANWSVKELKDLTHTEVAWEMKSSTFLISLNAFEALNTSVPEAMASGCVVFCYEGFGPRDYLKDNENAIVFKNNEAYQLVESVIDWIEHFEERENRYREIQKIGLDTANYYTREKTKNELLTFFKKFTDSQLATNNIS